MKKILLVIIIFINIGYICYGQSANRQNRAEALHVAFLTKQLELTPEEAQQFWPIYNSYREDLKEIRKSKEDELEVEEKILGVRKKYKLEFKKVLLSDQRVNKVFQAEKNFRELLRQELERRRNNQPV